MKTQGLALLVAVGLAAAGVSAAPPRVTNTSPQSNEGNVGINDGISVMFFGSVSSKSVNTNSFVVHGSQRGLYSGTFSWSGASQFTFQPASRFLRGEVVTVTLTTDIVSPTQEPMLKPYQFQFTVGSAAGTGHIMWDGDFDVPNGSVNLYPGDLDGDGAVDLAVAAITGSVSVLLNDGDAGFVLDSSYAVSSQPQDVTAGDIDRDGDLDLVAALQGSDSIQVLVNDGNGVYAPLGRYPSGEDCMAAVLLDYNGDGYLDIASANYEADTVTVLENLGGSGFSVAWKLSTSASPACVATGDFDGNHLIDLAAAAKNGQKVDTWLNDNGVLQPDSSYSIDYLAWRMVSADFNGDLEQDIATVNWGDCISVLLNNGDGTFAPHLTDSVSDYPRYMASGDMDGDGVQDLVISTHTSNEIVVMLNDGNGNFEVDSAYGASAELQGITLADFNKDGYLDAAALDWAYRTLEVYLGRGSDDCCRARGDLDRSGGPLDVSDLVWWVNWSFLGGQEPPCMEEADVNASGGIPDISDLIYLVEYMFLGGPIPPSCP